VAASVWGIERELAAAGLPALADKGYQGSTWAKVPYRGKGKPESQKEANRAHAKLRAPGEGLTPSSKHGTSSPGYAEKGSLFPRPAGR
jgi:hypothetical protein